MDLESYQYMTSNCRCRPSYFYGYYKWKFVRYNNANDMAGLRSLCWLIWCDVLIYTFYVLVLLNCGLQLLVQRNIREFDGCYNWFIVKLTQPVESHEDNPSDIWNFLKVKVCTCRIRKTITCWYQPHYWEWMKRVFIQSKTTWILKFLWWALWILLVSGCDDV